MRRIAALLLVCALLSLGAPLGAHHSTAMYTGSKTISGKVVKFEWTNPHAHMYIETKDDKGATVVWDCEMMSLNHLRSYGWTAKTVKVVATPPKGSPISFEARVRIDTPKERDYFRHGGILQYVLRQLASKAA